MDVSPRPACSSFHSQSGSCSSPVLIILSDTVSPSLCLPRHLSIYNRNFYYSVTIAWDNASTRPLNHHHPLHPFSFNGIYLNFKRPNLILPVLLPFQFVSLLSYSLRLMKSSRHIGWKKGHAIFPIRIPTVLSFNAIARRFLFFFSIFSHDWQIFPKLFIVPRKIGRIFMTMLNELICKSVPDKNRQTFLSLIYLKNHFEQKMLYEFMDQSNIK